ncbi:hypothetical protein FIU94_12445 [Sulfitobacter sp. THAF37]|uniref:hypothetical protein n=1 Tax=Sulfitobacter sp. THAF37 TaxID=2587855 RepID=UPI001267A079|nr:hypothetical protein [Sulfitobacter sp. THAF37]QFT59635.1 hypothetical protein FIU94_12445 [Sulfitobacter sp. THAF37]
MTATADFMNKDAMTAERSLMLDGGRMLVRTLQRIFGAGLFLAAFVIWLAPVSAQAEMMLLRLFLSAAAALAGIGMMLASGRPRSPEVRIDTIRRTVSLVRPDVAGRQAVLSHCGFRDLGAAEVEGHVVRLWDAEGQLLAVVTLTDRTVLESLTNGLRDAGKIA